MKTETAKAPKASASDWVARLSTLVQTLEHMDPEERAAALVYVKSRYRSEWPSDSY